MALVVKDDVRNEESLKDVLGKGHNSYPPMMTAALTTSIKQAAVKWIDANNPEAWYRAVFAN